MNGCWPKLDSLGQVEQQSIYIGMGQWQKPFMRVGSLPASNLWP